jgi:hypothetical protein
MAIVLAFLINASVFSIGGIGEDLTVFKRPFIERSRLARLGFMINPDYMLLNESGEFRGVFWTNPLKMSLSVPLPKGFDLMVGNRERFNQCFDVYLEDSTLRIHAVGEGGIEEVYAGLNKRLGPFDLVATGSFLFGSAWEIWTHSIGMYSLVDTFSYRYRGRIFNFGLKHALFSVAFESFGEVRKIYMPEETTMIDLPERLSIGVYPTIDEWSFGVVYERSFWNGDEFDSPNRFKVLLDRGSTRFSYYFNPWYFNDVAEHGLSAALALPLRNIGSIDVEMDLAMRSRDGLREFSISPKLTFVLNELFALRRK